MGDNYDLVVTTSRRRATSPVRIVVALLLGLGLGAMCIATAAPMSAMDHAQVAPAATSPVNGTAAVVERPPPSASPTDRACDACASVDCSVASTVSALGLLVLLLLLTRRGAGLVMLRRWSASTRRQTWRPSRPLLAPVRFELCILRV